MKLISRTPRLALAAVTVSLAMTVTACGGEGDSSGAGSPAKPVTITYWGWTAGAQQTADAFNKAHKDIQVKFSQITGGPDGYAKITNAIKAGNAPDLAGIEYAQLPEFAAQGLLEDLSGEAGATVKEKFPQPIQDLVTLGGKTWAVPFDASPQLLYYRKDLFQKAGVAVPKTWDEYKKAAAEIKKADKNVRIAAWGPDDPMLLAALSWQAGAKWYGVEGDAWKVGINDAASKKVADYWQGMAEDDLVAKASFTGEDFNKLKTEGKVASFIGASWSAGGHTVAFPKQSGKWGIAPLPNWGTASSGMYGGTTYAVPKGSKHVKEAAVFAQWVATEADAINARLSSLDAPSSALPANVEMREVAAGLFDDKGYFGDDDVYEIAGAQVDTIVPGWTWGPVQVGTNTAIQDAAGKGTLADALDAGQEAAAKAIEERGLNLAK